MTKPQALNDKELEELKGWVNGTQTPNSLLDYHISMKRLIATVEELKEKSRHIPNEIAFNQFRDMRARLQTHYKFPIDEPVEFALNKILELEKENAKLKEEPDNVR